MNEIYSEVFSLTVAKFRQIQGVRVKLFFPFIQLCKITAETEETRSNFIPYV